MDATTLLGPTNFLGLPAPFWFVEFFKVLGFLLHLVPMNLWYAGLVIVAFLSVWGSAHGKRFAIRMMKQMPLVIACGVNLGIVPLLFTQVAYYQVFYPATVLIAWPWFSIVPLLTVAYYGVYVYAMQIRQDRVTRLGLAAGWISALLFTAIGFIFANGLSLTTNVGGWPALWRATNVDGAPLGLALNVFDPTLVPRWLMMFGLALTTVAAYVIVDTAWLAGNESADAERKRWAPGFALKVATLGVVWFAVTGSWYIFGALRADVRGLILGAPLAALTALTASGPGLPWLLILAQRRGVTRTLALLTALAQFGVLALNAVSRQIVQNAEIGTYLDVSAAPVQLQLSPLIVFLVLFVIGLAVVAWMVSKVIAASRAPAPADIVVPPSPSPRAAGGG
jgi:hypothetical protein